MEQMREPTVHNIKCWIEPFEAMRDGRKKAEFRLNDRDYQVGDVLLIREFCPETKQYTHREITRRISHILDSGFGLPKGYAMLSLQDDSQMQPEIDRRVAEEKSRLLERLRVPDMVMCGAGAKAIHEGLGAQGCWQAMLAAFEKGQADG